MEDSKEKRLLICLVAVAAAGILALIGMIWETAASRQTLVPEPLAEAVPPETVVVEVTVPVTQIVEMEKVITAEILQDGLNDMGVLLTGEYYFTDVINHSKVATLRGWEIPMTESSFVISYDGLVEAGLDFSRLTVEKDEEAMVVTVGIPRSYIHNVTIDETSFRLISEQISVFNPNSAADFNAGLTELILTARQKAVEKGLLELADRNARNLIGQFIGTLVDTTTYRLEFRELT